MDGRRIAAYVLLVSAVLFGLRQVLPTSQHSDIVGVEEPYFVVYFQAESDGRLMPEQRRGYGTIEERLTAVTEGPRTHGLSAIVPRGTRVLGYRLDEGTLIVNFNDRLRTGHSGGSYGELLTVYGIVNSLVDGPGVRNVQILIDGEQVDSLAGHVYLREPLIRDHSLVGRLP